MHNYYYIIIHHNIIIIHHNIIIIIFYYYEYTVLTALAVVSVRYLDISCSKSFGRFRDAKIMPLNERPDALNDICKDIMPFTRIIRKEGLIQHADPLTNHIGSGIIQILQRGTEFFPRIFCQCQNTK